MSDTSPYASSIQKGSPLDLQSDSDFDLEPCRGSLDSQAMRGSITGGDTGLSVKDFGGAEGDGVADDTDAIIRTIEEANRLNRNVFFPGGWYYITKELPFYSNMSWIGEGSLEQVRYPRKVSKIVANDNETVTITLENPDILSYKIRDGDSIDTEGFAGGNYNNGLYGVKDVDPEAGTVTMSNPNGTTNENPPEEATVNLRISEGGSVVTMRNLGDGSTATFGRFIDARGIRGAKMMDIGFTGPGINNVFGGGIRFRRSDVYTSEALNGYQFLNVGMEHSAIGGFTFGQIIASSFKDMRVERCVRDGIRLYPEKGIGGATTSCHFDTIFCRGCRTGINGEIVVYCSFNNCVMEGTPIGYMFDRAIGCTFSSCASETIKHDQNQGRGYGSVFRFRNSYGNVVDGLTVYYNTEGHEWCKAAIEVFDSSGRTESPALEVRGGHLHQSLQERVDLIGTEMKNREMYWYLDVSEDPVYEEQSAGDTDGDWLKNTYINVEDMVGAVNSGRSIFDLPNYYVMTEIDHFPRDEDAFANNAAINSRPPGATDDASVSFQQFSINAGLWINDQEDPGYYVCVDDTIGAAKWIKWSASWFYKANYWDNDVTDLAPLVPGSSESWAISPGRQVGADIICDVTQRVYQLGYEKSDETMRAEVGVFDFLPSFWGASVDYDAWAGNDSRKYGIKGNKEIQVIDGDPYWVIELIVPSSLYSDSYPWTDTWEAQTDVNLRFDANGLSEEYEVAYTQEESDREALLVALHWSNWVEVGDVIDIYKPRMARFEGQWTVDAVEWRDSNLYSKVTPVLYITASGDSLTTASAGIDLHRTDALCRLPKFTNPPVSEVVVSGTSHTHIYDPAQVVHMGGGRDMDVEFGAGELQKSISVPAANMYHYRAYVEDSFTLVRKVSNDYYSVTLERNQDPGAETARMHAVRKKSPGFEIIAGKVNDGSTDFSPRQ